MRRPGSLRVRLLEALARGSYRHPWLFVAGGLLLGVVAAWASERWMGFKTSGDDLISPHLEHVREYRSYRDEFGDRDDLVIVVDEPDLRRAKAFVDELVPLLAADEAAVREVLHRIDPDAFDGKALMFLSPQELADMHAKLGEHGDAIERVAADPSLATLLRAINREISAAFVGHLVASFLDTGGEVDGADKEPLDLSLLHALVDSIGLAIYGQPTGSVWRRFLRSGSDLDEDGYLVDEDRRFVFVLVQVADDESQMAGAEAAIERVREHVAAVRSRHPGLQVGITGGPALAKEELQASVRDTSLASVIALAGVGLCFVLFYRDVARPLLAVTALTLGLAWSFGWITLGVGHLTILSVAFATMLIGMSDDFGVHLISRFEEETQQGHSTEEALRRTFVHSGGAIIAGAVTFAVAFFAMAFTDCIGMAELGIIGGGGVLLCLVAMLTVFPASLVLYERLQQRPVGRWIDTHVRLPQRLSIWNAAAIDRLYRRPGLLLALSAVLTLVSALGLRHVRYDTNLLNLQAVGAESVDWELRIIQQGRASRYAVSVADSLEQARALENAYEALPVVRRVESAASLIPDRQPERIAAIEALAPLAAALPRIEAPSEHLDVVEIRELLQSIRSKLQDDPAREWDPARKPDEVALARLRASLARVEPLLGGDPAALATTLLALQREVFLDFDDQIRFLQENLRPGPLSLETLPALLRDRFVGRTGRFSVRVFPEKNTWEPENLREFVAELRAVDAEVTGGPVSFYETSLRMRDGYVDAGLYALVAICLLVLWYFRSVRLALLALVPLGVGGLWTVGVMWLLGLEFNLANLIILPLIVGIGISNGIHIIHRHLENGSAEMSVIARSTGKGVVLSSLTTMVGFGALMVAQHQGIFSLGLLLAIGIGCTLLASLTVLPAILALASRR